MRYVLIVILSLILSSCSETEDTRFSEEEDKQSYTVEYEVLDSLRAVKGRYKEIWDKQSNTITKKTKGGIYGFAYDKGTKCIIVMAKSSEYTLKELERTLGHEHLHCRYGAWHK